MSEPPVWLAPLLGPDDVVAGPSPVDAVRQEHALDYAAAENRLEGPGDSTASHYFAMVDPDDPNRVLSFHALTPVEPDEPEGAWWTYVSDRWVRDPRAAFVDRSGLLRWVDAGVVGSVERQMVIAAEYRRRQQTGQDDDQLRLRLLRVLRQGGNDSIDLPRGYVQWAWYPAGLHLEVGDGQDYARPLEPEVWESVRWLGWLPPDDLNRNAWFEAEGEGAAEVAYDLVTRTVSVLRQAKPAVDVHDLFPPDFEPVPEWNVNPDGVDLDEPHYHDPDGEGLCMFCEAPADDPQHWPPVVAFAPSTLEDSLEETRQVAVNWALAHEDDPSSSSTSSTRSRRSLVGPWTRSRNSSPRRGSSRPQRDSGQPPPTPGPHLTPGAGPDERRYRRTPPAIPRTSNDRDCPRSPR